MRFIAFCLRLSAAGALLLGLSFLPSVATPINADELGVCRTVSTSTNWSSPVNPREWRCDPSNTSAAFITSAMYVPSRGGYPEITGFVWKVNAPTSLGEYTPYATVVHFTDGNSYGLLQAWLPTGNGVLTEARCWRFAGEGIYVEVQADECLARLSSR